HDSFEFETAEQSLASRVREYFRVKLCIRIGSRLTAHRACGYGSISSNCELIRKQAVHALVVHDQQYEIRGFRTDLQSHTASSEIEIRRSTPSCGGTAACHSAATASSNNES